MCCVLGSVISVKKCRANGVLTGDFLDVRGVPCLAPDVLEAPAEQQSGSWDISLSIRLMGLVLHA